MSGLITRGFARLSALAALGGSELVGTAGGRTLAARLSDDVAVLDTVIGGAADDTAAIQAILNSGKKKIDFKNVPLRCDTVTVPAGVAAINVNFTKITAGGNLMLVNTGSKVTGKLTGTGTTSIIERGVYPAANAARGVYLYLEVSNITVGVHAQPMAGTADADMPDGWEGVVYASNIVGTVGASEGYGVLLSPAKNCRFRVVAKTIRRHAVYLSAGAYNNEISATVDGCGNYAVQLYSTAAQPATEKNRVTVWAKNLSADVATQSGAAALVQKAHDNHITTYHHGAGVERHSIMVEGASAGPSPSRNHIDGHITGPFTGVDVVSLINETETDTRGLVIDARSAAIGIAVRISGANPATHAARVNGANVSFGGESAIGVYVDPVGVPCLVGENRISNNGAGLRVNDNSAGKRYGASRIYRTKVTSPSIPAGGTADVLVTMPFDIAIAGRVCDASIFQAGTAAAAAYSVQTYETAANQVTLRFFNGHNAAQTLSAALTVAGD